MLVMTMPDQLGEKYVYAVLQEIQARADKDGEDPTMVVHNLRQYLTDLK